MGYQTVATYYAQKPLRAEHPIGTGTIVEYAPGDVIPAGDWGASANWLVENGRAAVMYNSVWVDDEGGASAPPVEQTQPMNTALGEGAELGPPAAVHPFEGEEPLVDENAPYEDGVNYPLHEGAGWYQLSDGNRVRGKVNAMAAQAALGDSDE